MKRSLCSFIILIAQINICAQISLSGIIIDSDNGQSLSNAHVILLDDPSKSSITNEQGQFKISLSSDFSKGDLLVQYIGYSELLIPFDLDVDRSLEISMVRTVAEIDEIVVVATKSVGGEFVVEEINKMDIYTNPNSRADPVRAVQSLPASTSTEETANLSLRGSPPGETGFILNNVPIDDAFKLDQSNGVGQFSIFNTSIIKKVDVYPSNPPIEYGSSSSGLVALYTDDFNGVNGQSVNLTLAGMGLNVNRRIGQNNSLVAYANFGTQVGLKSLNRDAFSSINSFNSVDAGLYWITQFKENGKLKVFNYSLKESYDYSLKFPSFRGSALQNKKRNLTIINYEKRISKKISIDFNQGINFTKAGYEFGNSEHFISKSDLFTSFNLSHFTLKNSIKAGAAYDSHRFDNGGQYPVYYWANSDIHPFELYDNKMTIRNPEVFFYNKFRATEQLAIGFGLRKNILPSYVVPSYTSYQVNFNYRINEENSIVVSTGNYHKLFLPGEQFIEPTSALSNHYSVDYSLELKSMAFKAAFYKKNTEYPNQQLDVHGAELFLSYSSDRLNTSISVAHVSSEFSSEGVRYPSDHDLGYFVRHLLKYKVSSVLDFNSSFLHRSGKYSLPVSSSVFHGPTMTYEPIFANIERASRLPVYTLWDISFSYISELGNGSLLTFVSCSNVFDLDNVSGPEYNTKYERVGHQYFSPRVVFFGFVYNWN